MRRLALVLTLVASVLSACGTDQSTGASTPTVIKLSLILNQQSDWYAGAAKFKELIEERTSNRYTVRIYTEASLSNSNQRTELEMVQSGALHASLESSILLSLIEPRFSAFSLPWIFSSHEEANALCDGPVGQQMLDLLPEKQLVGLAYGANGFRQLTNSAHPVRHPDDLKDLKVRVPQIQMYISLFRLLDADPSSMNFGELIPALRTGAMDGQENPLSVIWSSKLYEVQEHISLWNYSYDPLVLCFNKSFFEALPKEDQALFRQAAREALSFERDLVAQRDREVAAKLIEAGVSVVPSAEVDIPAFQGAVEPLFEEYRDIIGAELIQAFRG